MMAYHADATDQSEKEILTWDGFYGAVREQALALAESGFVPEVIIGVARGGMIPAGALTYALGVKLTDAINVEFYTDVAETLPDPVLLAPMLDIESIRGRRLLVVDDVVDSGRTLALVLKLLRGFGADVRSAVIYAKPTTIIEPDYIWKRTDQWIVFPWSASRPSPAPRRWTTGKAEPQRLDETQGARQPHADRRDEGDGHQDEDHRCEEQDHTLQHVLEVDVGDRGQHIQHQPHRRGDQPDHGFNTMNTPKCSGSIRATPPPATTPAP